MTEAHPIPALAMTALAMLNANYQADLKTLAAQTVGAMSLDPQGGYHVDFPKGIVTRELPDPLDLPDSPPDTP